MNITLKNVSYVYNPDTPFEKKVLDSINLKIENGETIFVIGKTGSGKTTLLYLLDFLIKPTSGEVLVNDFENPFERPYEYRRYIGFAFQFPEKQFFSETVEDEIYFSIKNFRVDNPEKRFNEIVHFFQLQDYLKKSPFQLSGGEQRRIALASALAHDPKILILDEPTVGLDRKNERKIIEYLRNWKDSKGRTLVIVTHDIEKFSDFNGKVYKLIHGKLIRKGNKIEI
ncbi:ABC transporter [Thermosipho melanesiensis]|uniref:ABC transporter related n=2 Tax=Thermosipho melanesiensis TaxID=46541 RepID=A6LNT8_THEM4|nr:ATP-binding cassette domain-containing protein [Thermosipho melanesiensis]ABR31589.1 ABC transporter related [Thermosipho melanesiensis BI429]APT74620.1 ABC transporter ATP-binding protein [Thermosipho melanesiensis]OOC35325.1 ABC transporter [Thermosipho melanesiensis]OOC35543.1 ABC transporter [Thermosipho melanesiensis]OOC36580.1 ABC transporter [Thermosipho melanesiensis]